VPFNNPIVGGTQLVRSAIQSQNFVTGVSGWSINRDGSAEFAAAILRGEVDIGIAPNQMKFLGPAGIPAALVAFYAAHTETLTAVQLFTDATGRYEYIGNLSGGALVMGGVSATNVVQELMFLWNHSPNGQIQIGGLNAVDVQLVQGGVSLDIGTWIDYGPTGTNAFAWTATTTNPTIANATVVARYMYLNKHTVEVAISVKPAAGDTKGSGSYTFTLPVTARDAVAGGAVGSTWINDSGVAFRTGSVVAADSTHMSLWLNGAVAQVGSATLTGTFAGSEVRIGFTYEV
jgi:hypothetical protein